LGTQYRADAVVTLLDHLSIHESRVNSLSRTIIAGVQTNGYAAIAAETTQRALGAAWAEWDGFASSWDDLPEDAYMADGGRYRRRRYAVFDIRDGVASRAPHQAHYQATVYNRLNGGLERWFAPVEPAVAAHPVLQGLLIFLAKVWGTLAGASTKQSAWHVEVHQFRIEASHAVQAQPTPEGAHRDGVDYAFVMMVGRTNVTQGVTEIFAPDGTALGNFTLAEPGDATFLDDHRIFHAVTPIVPTRLDEKAVRDVLVITFTRQ
jgi:hypothetical protein